MEIEEFEKEYEKYAQENNELAKDIKNELLRMSFMEEHELKDTYAIVKIPACKLNEFGTACGTVNNKPFTQDAIDLLKSSEFVIAIVVRENGNIFYMMAKIGRRNGIKLDHIIDENNGSLRYDSEVLNGWSIFESE